MPQPGPGELLVELVSAPINPAELLMFEGRYGHCETVPTLPRLAGIEGVGRVVGGATDGVPEGSYVSLAGAAPVFADYRVMRAEHALVLPDGVDLDMVTLSLVNTQSVLAMLEQSPELQPGDTIIQNAGNSAYGRILDAVATRRGFHVINVVRSESAAANIRNPFGEVIIDGPELRADVERVTGGSLPKLAIDAVGGDATGHLAETLQAGGRVLTYGLMSGEGCRIDTRLVVFGGIALEGFWFPRSAAELGPERMAAVGREALEILTGGGIELPIEARYPLHDIAAALEHAGRPGRTGKVVVTR